MPAWRLGQLASHVDLRRDKGAEWGRQLLRDALETIVRITDVGGGKVIVIDADNEGLLGFYIRNGFKSTGVLLRPYGRNHRIRLKRIEISRRRPEWLAHPVGVNPRTDAGPERPRLPLMEQDDERRHVSGRLWRPGNKRPPDLAGYEGSRVD